MIKLKENTLIDFAILTALTEISTVTMLTQEDESFLYNYAKAFRKHFEETYPLISLKARDWIKTNVRGFDMEALK